MLVDFGAADFLVEDAIEVWKVFPYLELSLKL
jgi:hypothetical protein